MKNEMLVAVACLLLGIAGPVSAEPAHPAAAGSSHAGHDHAAGQPAPDTAAEDCHHAMQGAGTAGAGMGAMPGMTGEHGATMDHRRMMAGSDMKGCVHKMHDNAGTPPAPPSASPAR